MQDIWNQYESIGFPRLSQQLAETRVEINIGQLSSPHWNFPQEYFHIQTHQNFSRETF